MTTVCLVAEPLIKFSNEDDLTKEDCQMFLMKYMEQGMFVNKLLQRLFVRLEVRTYIHIYSLCGHEWSN